MRSTAVFEKVNALPCSQLQPGSGDRDRFTGASECHPDVAGHIIRAFAGVLEPWRILRHEPLEELMQVMARALVRIFHNDETGTGVPHKNGDKTFVNSAVAETLRDFIGDLRGAFALGGDLQGVVAHRAAAHLGN